MEPLRDVGKLVIVPNVGKNPGILRVAHPAADSFHRTFARRTRVSGVGRLEHMRSHALLVRLVQDQIGKIELHHIVEPRRQIAKKLIELTMGGNRLRNLQERLVAAMWKIRLPRRKGVIVHSSEDIWHTQTVQEREEILTNS